MTDDEKAAMVTARRDVESIDRWLADKRCVIWGQGFDISDDGRRRRAALWLYGQIIDWVASIEADK